jgi:predicted NBD/HSP70 family sugar kinase
VIAGGSIVGGHRGLGGEFGHVLVPHAAELEIRDRFPRLAERHAPRLCDHCGQFDCLQVLASCRAIVDQLRDLASDPAGLTFDDVLVAAREHPGGELLWLEAIAAAGMRVGSCLAQLVHVLDPELVVIGGFMSGAGEAFIGPIRERVGQASIGINTVPVETVDSGRLTRSEVEGAIAFALARTELPVPG